MPFVVSFSNGSGSSGVVQTPQQARLARTALIQDEHLGLIPGGQLLLARVRENN